MEDLRLHGLLGGGSNIKSIQKGKVFYKSVNTLNIPISTVDLSKSIALIEYDPGNGNGRSVNLIAAELVNSTTLNLSSQSAYSTAGGGIPIVWNVIEFNNVKSKQSGIAIMNTELTLTQSISSINPDKSLILATSKSSSGADTYYGDNPLVEIISSTQIKLTRSFSNYVCNVKWQLIEFN